MENITKFIQEMEGEYGLSFYDQEVLLGMIKKFGEDMYDGGYDEAQSSLVQESLRG